MQAGTPDILTVDNVDKAMLAWFAPIPVPIASRKPFSETDLREISNVLRRTGKDSWSRIPRIYATLRVINQLPAIDSFIAQGLNDVWFPFGHKSLPLGDQAAKSDFLEAQKLVLNKGLDLEKEEGKHRHFSDPAEIPFQKISELGKGAFGFVDRVLSTISYKEYARKLIPRGRTFRKNREVLANFEKELATLKKLSHIHIVELIGSYTDPRFVGIIMSPVADQNLKQFLNLDLSPENCSFLRTFFGCLTAALMYLHENRIRHKDIKPQNVLVKAHQVLLTDFGISLDWSELSHGTTTSPTMTTPRYCAPEVAAREPKNSSADIWSLGCVFLEMWSVLCGETIASLDKHMTSAGSGSPHFCHNIDGIVSWCDKMCSKMLSGSEEEQCLEHPRTWILSMLKPKSKDRCDVQTLFDLIQETNTNPCVLFTFTGLCCIEDEYSDGSVLSSIFEHDIIETTHKSDTITPPHVPVSTATSQRPLSEPLTWASSQDIATFVRELNSEEKQRSAQGRLHREDGAIRTPSKEIQDSLDRAIDERINDEKKSGRMFLPWNGK